MSIGAYELLTGRLQDSGPLKGKVLSDITLPMESRPGCRE
jgi:hypothetical protein